MGEYLSFNKFITPAFAQVIFWIGVVGLVLFLIFGGGGYGGPSFFVRLIGFLIGIVIWRVYMEIILIFFRIHGELVKIDKNTGGGSTSA